MLFTGRLQGSETTLLRFAAAPSVRPSLETGKLNRHRRMPANEEAAADISG